MTIKLEVGKKYRDRMGEVCEIIDRRENFYYQFFGKFSKGILRGYTESGEFFANRESGLDLIEEVIDEPVKKPIKWAKEAHAYIEGVEGKGFEDSEWSLACKNCNPITAPNLNWRIAVQQWRKDLAEKMRAGGVLQFNWGGDNPWKESLLSIDRVLDAEGNMAEGRYRIKPKKKPDVVETWSVSKYNFYKDRTSSANLKLIWDGEGKLKDAEVLK